MAEIEKKTSEEMGLCPNCKSEDLEYQPLEIDGEYCEYPFICNGCKAGGSEYYTMVYDATVVYAC